MPLNPDLVGHSTRPETATISADDIRAFVAAIGDTNPLFRDPAAAQLAGFEGIPVPPTFVTRFRVPFAEAGLDPEHMQVLHGDQEYAYERPLVAGETVTAHHTVASLRMSKRADGMSIMTLEQAVATPDGARVVTGKAIVIVREQAPGADAGAADTGRAKQADAPEGEQIPLLTKHITQEQINAYAEVSGDHNPIHLDPAAARAVGLDGTIAHGMLSMAFAGELLTNWLSREGHPGVPGGWVRRLRVRFQGMVRPGDTLTIRGALGQRDGDRQPLNIWIENQRGERVTTGEADVALRG